MASEREERIKTITQEIRAQYESRLREENLLLPGQQVIIRFELAQFALVDASIKFQQMSKKRPESLVPEEQLYREVPSLIAFSGINPQQKLSVHDYNTVHFEYVEPAILTKPEVVELLSLYPDKRVRQALVTLLIEHGNEPYFEEFLYGEQSAKMLFWPIGRNKIPPILKKFTVSGKWLRLAHRDCRPANMNGYKYQLWEIKPKAASNNQS